MYKLAYICHTFALKTESDNPHYCLEWRSIRTSKACYE